MSSHVRAAARVPSLPLHTGVKSILKSHLSIFVTLLKLQDVLDLNCRKHIVVKLIVNKDLTANSKNIWPRCGLYCGHFYNNPM